MKDIGQRIGCLRGKRADLRDKIEQERAHLSPDELGVARMKRERCRLKDEIIALEQRAVQTMTA